jgi:hypothetical protein
VTIDADPADFDAVVALQCRQRQRLVCCGADRGPPGVGVSFAWVYTATGGAACNRDRCASFSVNKERFH